MRCSILLVLLISLYYSNEINAGQCTSNTSNNNKLVNSFQSYVDTAPYFKTNDLYSYKTNSWDKDIDEYAINYYGNKLTLTGNTWKFLRLKSAYTLTPNSVLEFEFRSRYDEAEINGVGLIMYGASGFNGARFFQIHGTQVNSNYNQDYHNHSGDKWIKYQIPLWNSTSNTSEKRVQSLVFAGDDDNAQVNQNVNFKNVRIIEDASPYQLPSNFDHFPVEVDKTSNKNYSYHKYAQKIVGPDNKTYSVSDGSIILKYYEPPNIGTQYLISVQENYYQNLCWDSPILYSETAKEQDSWDRLQTIAITQKIDELIDDNNNQLVQVATSYFDPDFKSVTNPSYSNKSPKFIHEYRIKSNNHNGIYIDKVSGHDGLLINNGFTYLSSHSRATPVTCGTANSGRNTSGNCFDLSGKTDFENGDYLSKNSFTNIRDAKDYAGSGAGNPTLVKDNDNIWDGADVKNQVTDMIVNSEYFNDFLNSFTGESYKSITGWNLNSIVNSRINPSLDIPLNGEEPRIILRKAHKNTPSNGPVTDSKSLTLIGHEFSHALTATWFGLSLATNDIQGCAINEGYGDIVGIGTRYHATGVYNPDWLSDLYDTSGTNESLNRNISNPQLNGDPSYFDGDNEPSGECTSSGSNQVCNIPGCEITRSGSGSVSFHSMGVIIGHLYHLMVNDTGASRFNADSSFRPDSFGVSSDEGFTHNKAQKIFYDSLDPNNSNSREGSVYTFCSLRDDMIDLSVSNGYERTAIQQAWKHIYKDIQTVCPVSSDSFLQPQIEIKEGVTTTINDGDLIDFGTVAHGSEVSKTFTITNTGEYPLRLIDPQFSNGSFDQKVLNTFGPDDREIELGTSQEKIDVGESVYWTLKFTASANDPTVNTSTLTFETNLPNGTENQHFFNINLKALSVPPQNNADAYEDDDSSAQAHTVTNVNPLAPTPGNMEQRNFNDDSVDWIKVYRNSELGTIGPHQAHVALFNFGNSQIEICYEIIESISLVNNCVIIQQNSSHLIGLIEIQPVISQTREYLIKLSNPFPQTAFNYSLYFTSTVPND